RVQPFKVGPDYLDTGWHTAICGVASRNLASFTLPPPVLTALFSAHPPPPPHPPPPGKTGACPADEWRELTIVPALAS
ncbi:hypothetical protein C4813_14290, partial [Salmonella enterica subsp. enterica serovar Rubislaw]